jgi:hypothetical protein
MLAENRAAHGHVFDWGWLYPRSQRRDLRHPAQNAPSQRDSGGILVDPFPPLKRWANQPYAYGAGELALSALSL